RNNLWNDDLRHLVLVYRPVDRTKNSQRERSRKRPQRNVLLRDAEDSAGLHPGAAGPDREGSLSDNRDRRQRLSNTGPASSPQGPCRPDGGGSSGGADVSDEFGAELLLHADHDGYFPQDPSPRQRE